MPDAAPSDVVVFFVLLVFFSYLDLARRIVTNWIVLPIAAFVILHDTLVPTLVFYALSIIIGLYDIEEKKFLRDVRGFSDGTGKTLYRGGDAKLMTLAVAAYPFAGVLSALLSWVFVASYRVLFADGRKLPYAPFLLASFTTIFFLAKLCPVKI